MSERDDAIALANRLLDEPHADPDDDLRVLARQLIRATERTDKRRASWLDVPVFFRLDWCCRGLTDAFGGEVYLVGSCMERPDYRDVDVSLMLPDDRFAAIFPNKYALLLLNAVISEWLSTLTGLRIDFKFQDTTRANTEHRGPRNPLGIRAGIFSQESAL